MKFALTPFDLVNIKDLSNLGVDTFIMGNDNYANRLTKSFSEVELRDASELIKSLGKELIIQMNLIVHNEDLKRIDEFLDVIKELDVSGIIFGDLGVYNIAKRKGLEHKLIYNPETLNTNFYDPKFWARKGIKGILISREITLQDIKTISSNKPLEIGIVGHGHLNMFHSRRPLISNFLKFNEKDHEQYLKNRNLRLVEEIRNEPYPVFQDEHGTHIFRDKIMESYQEIKELNNHLDYFIIDGIFKDTNYLKETITNYQNILKDKTNPKQLSDLLKETHDSGFLYKKTVYDKY